MTQIKDGGPAFPVVAENGLGHIADGMSLRDWFAGQALAAFSSMSSPAYMATYSYELADAMIAAREVKS